MQEATVEFLPQRVDLQTPRQFDYTQRSMLPVITPQQNQMLDTAQFHPLPVSIIETNQDNRTPRKFLSTSIPSLETAKIGESPIMMNQQNAISDALRFLIQQGRVARVDQDERTPRRFVSTTQSAAVPSTVTPVIVHTPVDAPLFSAELGEL